MRTAPRDWSRFHSRRCGTEFRGCAPECPKDVYERTDEWTGPAWPLAGQVRSVPAPGAPGSFGARRKHDVHTGIDLHCDEGTRVFAVRGGVVVSVVDFTGAKTDPPSPWWEDTKAVLVRDEHFVLCYGEIAPDEGVVPGTALKPGDPVGRVLRVLRKDKGSPVAMLHLEAYKLGTTEPVWWRHDEPQPENLLDPTPFITHLIECPEEGCFRPRA